MLLLKKHTLYLSVLSIIFLLGSGDVISDKPQIHKKKKLFKKGIINPCPTENAKNRGILEEFLTESQWSKERQESNTNHLKPSQIKVLESPEYSSVCSQFNDRYEEAFTEEWQSGGKKYDVTYFKAGNFFFVLISLRAPKDPNVAGTGVDYLHVYDQNVNLIEAYAF